MKSVSVGLFQHRNGTFYTIRRTGKKQQWRSLNTTDKTEALRKLVFQIDVSLVQPRRDFPRFEDIAEQWLGSIRHTDKPTTYDWRKWCVHHLVQRLEKQTLDDITTADIEISTSATFWFNIFGEFSGFSSPIKFRHHICRNIKLTVDVDGFDDVSFSPTPTCGIGDTYIGKPLVEVDEFGYSVRCPTVAGPPGQHELIGAEPTLTNPLLLNRLCCVPTK